MDSFRNGFCCISLLFFEAFVIACCLPPMSAHFMVWFRQQSFSLWSKKVRKKKNLECEIKQNKTENGKRDEVNEPMLLDISALICGLGIFLIL